MVREPHAALVVQLGELHSTRLSFDPAIRCGSRNRRSGTRIEEQDVLLRCIQPIFGTRNRRSASRSAAGGTRPLCLQLNDAELGGKTNLAVVRSDAIRALEFRRSDAP